MPGVPLTFHRGLTDPHTVTHRRLRVTEYHYAWTAERLSNVFQRPLYRSLIASEAFQRLADIRFLGAIDYFIHPTGQQLHRRRHTRLEHTLGVAHLALFYSDIVGLPDEEEKLVVCAALLHDIGHAPLSHSLEAPFTRRFGIDHHSAGNRIIMDRAPRGLGKQIHATLVQENIDPKSVVALIEGTSSSVHSFLFAHPINIDTMEAISRSETYIKSGPTSPTPEIVLKALLDPIRGVEQLDSFWSLKDRIYSLLIQGPIGILADYVSLQYVEQHLTEFSESDFFISERVLRRGHPKLFKTLELARRALVHYKGAVLGRQNIEILTRRFFIDTNYPAGAPERYRQTKLTTVVALADLQRTAHRELPEVSHALLF